MGIKRVKGEIINAVSNMMSYPMRTLHNARAEAFNRKADAIKLARDKKAAFRARGKY